MAKTDLRSECWQQAKRDVLSVLPHALSTICDLWGVVRSRENPRLPLGNAPQLGRLIVDLLSPIAHTQQTQFLQSMSLVWLTRSPPPAQRRTDTDVVRDFTLYLGLG